MDALEQIIVEQVRLLDTSQQRQVLEFLQTLQPAPFDFATWQRQLDAIHAELRAEYGEDYSIDVQGLLDELREESS